LAPKLFRDLVIDAQAAHTPLTALLAEGALSIFPHAHRVPTGSTPTPFIVNRFSGTTGHIAKVASWTTYIYDDPTKGHYDDIYEIENVLRNLFSTDAYFALTEPGWLRYTDIRHHYTGAEGVDQDWDKFRVLMRFSAGAI
jgi:hypothetical protein